MGVTAALYPSRYVCVVCISLGVKGAPSAVPTQHKAAVGWGLVAPFPSS